MNDTLPMVFYSLIAGLAVAGVAYVMVTFVRGARGEARRFRTMGRPAASPFFKLLKPVARGMGFFVGGISARVEMSFGRAAEKSFLLPLRLWSDQRLRSANYPEGVTADEFVGMLFLGLVFGGLAGLLLNFRLSFPPVVLFMALVGAAWPWVWLRGQLRRRQTTIRRDLPYSIDLLTISVEAGLDFTEALSRIVRKLGARPLAAELGQTVRDIQLGRTRIQALRDLSRRVDVSELNSLTSALIQADELGSSLGPILRVQAEQLRTRRSQLAEKKAMEAPVKILFPLVFMILPNIFIMIGMPIVLRVLGYK